MTENFVSKFMVKVFADNTGEVINGQQFLEAQPETLKVIYELDTLEIESEVDLIKALERYIEHNQKNDSEIVGKVRPALNNIRFLTMKAKEVVRTSLLTPEEKVDVIHGLEPDVDLSKMPKDFSLNTNNRSYLVPRTKMIRSLSDVYSFTICNFCRRCHALWNCNFFFVVQSRVQSRKTVSTIFNKYEHVSLKEYECADLETIYGIYKQWGLITE